uniref:Uncharacterized protein n=1 Tax=Cucumis sativus TaxID=3659 RepID=A0A0A0KEM5_CUCSA
MEVKEQLCERDQAIRKLERKIEDIDRELQSIKLDNEANDLLREQEKEIATYRLYMRCNTEGNPLMLNYIQLQLMGIQIMIFCNRDTMILLDKERIFNRWRLNSEHKLLQD